MSVRKGNVKLGRGCAGGLGFQGEEPGLKRPSAASSRGRTCGPVSARQTGHQDSSQEAAVKAPGKVGKPVRGVEMQTDALHVSPLLRRPAATREIKVLVPKGRLRQPQQTAAGFGFAETLGTIQGPTFPLSQGSIWN